MIYRYSIYKQRPQPAELLLWAGFGAHGNQATSFTTQRGRSINTHYSQNYWIFGLCPSSGILKTKKRNVSESGSNTRVEAGSNTSTVTLRIVVGDEKGSLKSETVKYGLKSQETWTREKTVLARASSIYKRQT
jgi:hypothetical protein